MRTHVKKVIVAILGTTVLLAGVVMLVFPGPAFIVIPAGLAILATEFVWAERLKQRAKDYFHQAREKHRQKKQQRAQRFSAQH